MKKQDKDINRILKTRAIIAGLLILGMFSPIVIRLMRIQLVDGEETQQKVQQSIQRTIALKGMRGKITDKNGQPLAYDRRSFDVEFYRDPSKSKDVDYADYAKVLSEVISLIEAEGGSVIDDAWIVRDSAGNFSFDFGTEDPEVAQKRETMWRENFYLASKDKTTNEYKLPTAEDCYRALASRYHIPMLADEYKKQLEDGTYKLAEGQSPDDVPTVTWEKAHKLLSIWQGVQETAMLTKPYKIAHDVSRRAVALIESRTDLTGVTIASGSMRVYPRGVMAGNVVGYTAKIPAELAKDYTQKGYSIVDDRIGVAGVESTMESQLSGSIAFRQGERKVEINSKGKITRETSVTQPTNGNNVTLTLDIKLQEIAYNGLAETIERINEAKKKFIREDIPNMKPKDQERYDEYLKEHTPEDYNANMGACVVLDVKTGNVLALASYPTYDPNDFLISISNAEYDEKFRNNPALPLFDKAISSREMPGSIFKMCTGIAGMMEGKITANTVINCRDYFIPTGVTDSASFRHCWTNYPSKHQDQNLEAALKNSCNIYFYTVAQRLGIEKLSPWASKLGLTSKTGIELPHESTSIVGSQDVLYDPDLRLAEQKTGKPYASYRAIIDYLRSIGAKYNKNYEDERLDRATMALLETAVTTKTNLEMHSEIRKILLSEMGLTPDQIEANYMGNEIIKYARELRWTSTETIMTGVGQSVTRLSPIAVARYIAAIANGGTVYDTHIVDRILRPDGSVEKVMEPVVATETGGLSDVLAYIKAGMRDVAFAEDGTASSQFVKSELDPVTGQMVDYAYKDNIGVKTGTAQTNTKRIELENHAWMVGFAPYDKPEIAVVVFIPHGLKGAYASTAFKRVVSYYMERRNSQDVDVVPEPFEMVE